MANEEVKFTLGAEDTGVAAEMRKISGAVTTATNEIKGKFASVTEVFSKVQGAFLAFTAVLAGGKAFKEAITSTVEMEKSAASLGKQLGISTTEASVLAVALDDVHLSQETFTSASGKIAVNLKKNEEAFKNLGVATRDQNGNFRNQLDIQLDVNAALLKFKEGTDRNVEGVKIYGKSWAEVAPTLKVTHKAIDDAREKAASLGLVIGQESVAATDRYRNAMNDVDDVVHGVQKAIGDALLPALSAMGEWFAGTGPTVVHAFQVAMAGLTAYFDTLVAAVKIAFEALSGFVRALVVMYTTITEANAKVLTLDFRGAADTWSAGFAKLKAIGTTAWANIKADAVAASEGIGDAFDRVGHHDTPTNAPKGGATSDGGDDKLKNQMAAQEAKLAAFKANFAKQLSEQGNFQEFSKQMERDYWAAVLNTSKLSEENKLQIKRKVADLEVGIAKQSFEEKLAQLKTEESAVQYDYGVKIDLARQYADQVAAAYGAQSKQAEEVQQHILELERQKQAQLAQIQAAGAEQAKAIALSEVGARELAAQLSLELGDLTNAQFLQQERQFQAERFQIESDALQRKKEAAAANRDIVEVARLNTQIELLQLEHEQRMRQIQAQTTLDAKSKWKSTFDSMQSGFQGVLQSFLRGTMTIKGLFQNLFAAVADSLAQMVAKNIANIAMQALMGKTTALKELNQSAVVAAGKAYEAVVGTPFIGPVLAPAAAGVAYAGVMAFGSQLSAEQGYDIPAGVNPVVQTHQREMILPQKYADTIRGLADEGGGAGRAINITYNIKANDGASVKKMLMEHGPTLASSLKAHMKGMGRMVPMY